MSGGDGGLPVVEPPFADAPADPAPRVAGVVLAAGTSSRFGDRNKLLATRGGEPLVRRAARTLLATRLDPVVAVVGHEADRVAGALDGLDVEIVRNDAYAEGQATSVRAGIEALSDRGVDAALIALGDMPFLDPETIETLLDAYAAGVGSALAAAHAGDRGNPVLFDRTHFAALCAVDGDVGGREILLEGEDSACVAVDDPGVRRDIDEPGDLE
ncbi:nucleotidyltransferase family protein [Halobellus rubicundus]|uniref:NTP transferase domain-containing protein n=1 Tax=Halobellus rubicundus TaxID=2996466 RepID=A0ABD5MDH9_9EURY